MSGSILLYVLVVAVSAIAAVPVTRRVFGDERPIPLISISLTIGVPLALLLFALVTRAMPSYAVAVPVTLLLLGLPWACDRWRAAVVERRSLPQSKAQAARTAWGRGADGVLLGVYALLFVGLVALRAGWPSLYWDNDVAHAGSEKVFNLSLIQAYLFGRGYPPENLWLAGEPLDYYVLLHALPGIVSWGWRVLTGDAAAGGTLFIVSDVFLLLLGSLALSAWSQALFAAGGAGLSPRQSLVLSLGLGVGVLLSTHAKAVRLVLAAALGGAHPAWWELEREVVPWTYSQYPFYLLLQGDHHAFQRIFFLQIALYGAMALLFLSRRLHWPRVLLTGGLAAAVQLAHSGSVLLDIVVFGIAAAGVAGLRARRGERELLRVFVVNLAATTAVALALSVPALWGKASLAVAWYWVEASGSSPLVGFLEAQAGPLLFVAAACAAGVLAIRGPTQGRPSMPWKHWPWAGAAIVGTLVAVGRGGAAVAATCVLLVLMLAPYRSPSGEDRTPLVVLAAAVFGAWLLPEFVVADLASRPVVEWKRWNLAMRFWLEGHYLVPFLTVQAFAPALRIALEDRGYQRALAAGAALAGSLWLVVHVYGVADRRARTPDVPGMDGTAFLVRQHPCDAAIVHYLQDLKGRVQIGELCGTGEVIPGIPLDYGWTGRIAAFSGRPGICGWSRHVRQFSRTLRHGPAAGQDTWGYFREYERQLQQVYLAARHGLDGVEGRAYLRRLGVTHVVVGEQERGLFPGLSGMNVARSLGGRVVYAAGDSCAVVSLSAPGSVAAD